MLTLLTAGTSQNPIQQYSASPKTTTISSKVPPHPTTSLTAGVADPNLRLTKDKQDKMNHWIQYNAARYWLSEGGPLAPGGADVVIIDDPQMPGLIPLIKEARPSVPIIYRSHIEIRSDLVERPGSPQKEVWDYLWERIQLTDVFISHPVSKFVPHSVPLERVALVPATSDWYASLE